MKIEGTFVLEPAALERLAPEWRGLEAHLPGHLFSLSHAYFAAWRKLFGAGVECGVVTLRESGTLLAVMPVMIARCWRGPAMSVRFDYYPGDMRFVLARSKWRYLPVQQLSPPISLESGNLRGGYLAHPQADAELVRRHLAIALMAVPGWTVGVFPIPIDETDAWEALLRDGTLRGFIRSSDRRFYRRRQLDSWQAFLRSRNAHFRRRYKEATKRAEQEGLIFKTFSGPDEIRRGLDILADVSGLSWKNGTRDGEAVVVPYSSTARAFFETLCTGDGGSLKPVVAAILQGDSAKAAILSVTIGGNLVTLLTFHDPALKRVSVGRLLIKMAYEWAVDNELAEIDFNATSPWVEPYSNQADEYGQMVIFGSSHFSRILEVGARMLAGRARGQR